jgi:hypothetical protein
MPIAVLLQPISGLSAINPLVAFYDIIVIIHCDRGSHDKQLFLLNHYIYVILFQNIRFKSENCLMATRLVRSACDRGNEATLAVLVG